MNRAKALPLRKALRKKTLRRAALSACAAVLCLLTALGLPDLSTPIVSAALEASLFNGGRSYEAAAAAAAPVAQPPGKVVPLGSVFGIKLFTDGVIVASLSEIDAESGLRCPAAESGIHPGDYILEVDGQAVSGNRDLAARISAGMGKPVTLRVRRGEDVFETTVTPLYDGISFKTGMWVRDSAAGIGTLTFCDPATGLFAGLGHGICDMDVNTVMSLKSGEPAAITLCGVERGEAQSPGMLRGYFTGDEGMGRLLANNETGVYGTLNELPGGEAVEVLPREQVKKGPAEILATVDETGPQRYKAEITKISGSDQHTKNLIIRVTDQRLIERTGGIVQGMSGCPVFQNGKLAAAVTHVFLDDPAVGYGIYAQTMCEELAALAQASPPR